MLMFAVALVAAVHSICTANAMTKSAPLTIAIEIVTMFGFSVGAVVSAWDGNQNRAAEFLIVAFIAKVVAVLDMLMRGYGIKFSVITCATYPCPDDHCPTDHKS